MIMNVSRDLNYRSAISLNNIGVALLERGAPQHALNTLKDAVHVTSSLAGHSEEPPAMSSFQVALMLSKAAQRLASTSQMRSQRAASSSRACRLMERDSTSMRMEVGERTVENPAPASDSDEQNKHASLISTHMGFSEYAAPIYIDDTEINSLTDRDPDLDSSIMLLNFGIAHLCTCETPDILVSRTREEVERTALMLFTLSYQTLNYGNELGESALHRITLLVAIMLLSNLTRLSFKLGNHEKAREYYDRLVLSRRVLQEFNHGAAANPTYCSAGAA